MTTLGTPQTTDKTAKTIDDIINEAMMKLALQAAEKAIEADVPALDFPVIKQAFELGMQVAFQYVDTALEQMAAFATMDAQANVEAASFQNAKAELQAALDSGDQSAIDKANTDFNNTLGNLIHYDGS